MQLCEECAQDHREREKRLSADDDDANLGEVRYDEPELYQNASVSLWIEGGAAMSRLFFSASNTLTEHYRPAGFLDVIQAASVP
jgi:hypothetical protein